MDQNLEIVFSISAVNAKIIKSIDRRISVHGISFSEFTVMHRLYDAPNQSMRRIDLAESVGLSASGVTRMLSPMEKLKIVEKEPNPRDARVSSIKLTGAGSLLYEDALKSVNDTADMLFENIDNNDTAKLIEVFNKIK